MSDMTIYDYDTANTIDGSTHWLLIQPGNNSVNYNKINRSTYLGVSGQPMDISSSQNVTNKTLDNTNTITVKDTLFTLQDDSDTTKQARFQLSGITTATIRTYTLPNASSTLADIATAQTFTNKTLTSPVITGGSIDNTTITVDAITGHTASTTGSIYGLSIASAKIGSNGVVTASITDSSVTNPKLNNTGSFNSTWATTAWVPTFTGFSANPAGGLYYYTQVGKLVTLFITMPADGTSNATGFTLTLPVTARTIANMFWSGPAQVRDNSAVKTAPGLMFIQSAGTTLNVSSDYSGAAWTAAGGKRIVFGTITYEAA